MMTYEQILKDLKNKIYKPVYFLMGEEPYYIDKISNYIQNNVLDEVERDFNQTILYGKDSEILDVVSAAKRFPMMANHQVIIVKEAQELKKFEDILLSYIENPLTSTILVFNYKYKSIKKTTKLYKRLEKIGVTFESKKLRDYEVPKWIEAYVKREGIEISPEGVMMLSEFLGTDLSKIVNEIEKLLISLPENEKKITPAIIERNIGISKDFNQFELTNALGTKNILKANQIVNYFSKNEKNYPLVVTISALYNFFSSLIKFYVVRKLPRQEIAATLGINPYFIGQYETASKKYSYAKASEIISLLREYDMKSKGVNNISASDGELLKELVFKILH